jgi:hypothetical protein
VAIGFIDTLFKIGLARDQYAPMAAGVGFAVTFPSTGVTFNKNRPFDGVKGIALWVPQGLQVALQSSNPLFQGIGANAKQLPITSRADGL